MGDEEDEGSRSDEANEEEGGVCFRLWTWREESGRREGEEDEEKVS